MTCLRVLSASTNPVAWLILCNPGLHRLMAWKKNLKGAKVADVGCGYGIPAVIMAKSYSNSGFYGHDTHSFSIEASRQSVQRGGVADGVEFHLASANENIGNDYYLVVFFDCVHDIGDPARALRFAK